MSSIDPALIALALIPRIGGKTLTCLLDEFGTPEAVLMASPADLYRIPGIGEQTAQEIKQINLNALIHRLQKWQSQGIQVITWQSPHYPDKLKQLVDCPPVLFHYGGWHTKDPRTVAVVGTRTPTEPAAQFAQLLAYKLAEAGWTVISGLARGIDTSAHIGALAIPVGVTVAVLGSGIKRIYPPENRHLARRLVARGGLLSEVAPTAEPSSGQLVARNRIISGLSQAVVLVETGIPGGAMHTVRFAKTQHRPIYVLNFAATGNQQLIAENIPTIQPDMAGINQFIEAIEELT